LYYSLAKFFILLVFRHIRHANISCLLGICNQPEDAFSLVMYEYLNNGDLHEYIISQRLKTIDLTDFLHILIQIVSGMIYLSEKSFLHNDLSTKNIFISEHMNIKITNIARYRRKYHLDYYKIANRLLPVRWMAIESLLSGIYSEMSDVWSFGVLVWEMFSYGIQPYYGQTNPEVIEMIRDGNLLTCPTNCPKRVYALMCSCWQEISEQRPTFMELMGRLRQLEEKSTTDDEPICGNQVESPTAKYRTLLLPVGRSATQPMLVDRNSIRLES
jgi:serine/threonine protein kinase